MSVQITRRLEFDAGHRVFGHEGKCAHLHGHRYVVEITVEADMLDNIGRVIDFSAIKSRIGTWIDQFWDHALLLNSNDPMVDAIASSEPKHRIFCFLGKNPTAEVIVEHLFYEAQRQLPTLVVKRVRCFETPNCWADFPPY